MKFLYRLSDKVIVGVGAVNPKIEHEIANGVGVYGKDPEFYTIDGNGDVQPKSQIEVDAILQARAGVIAQREADQAQKAQDIIDNLPSWAQVETAVDNIANLADAKAFIKKLSRIVYWLARNKKD